MRLEIEGDGSECHRLTLDLLSKPLCNSRNHLGTSQEI